MTLVYECGFIFCGKLKSLNFCPFFCISPTTQRADSGNANAGVFGHFHVFRRQDQEEKIWVVGFTLPSLRYTHFDQNQELVHFGKVTPPQRGRIPEMPIAGCFRAENPLFFENSLVSGLLVAFFFLFFFFFF